MSRSSEIASGGGCGRLLQGGLVMNRIGREFFAASLFAAWALIFVLPQTAHAAGMFRVSEIYRCLDGMVTDPYSDELDPILAASDAGCTIQRDEIISI